MAESAALAAALCWALASLFAASASRALGGIAFTRIRMAMVFALLVVVVLVRGPGPLPVDGWAMLLASGVIGIFVGDTALFVALSRLGPRRTSILFATNAPMTVVLAWLILGEGLSPAASVGCVLVAIGVLVAIVYGKRREQLHLWESVHGNLLTGVGIGLLAALGQSVGSLMAAPALKTGMDPVTVTTIRIGAALVALYVARALFPARTRPLVPLTPALWGRVLASGLLGMALGMSFLLYAFANGPVGLAAALSSLSPVMMVPIIWIVSRERPALGAWIGAALAVGGSALILLR